MNNFVSRWDLSLLNRFEVIKFIKDVGVGDGIKCANILISGERVYNTLKHEAGVHK